MKYPGKPEAPPRWYKERNPSYIENKFNLELGNMADLIERKLGLAMRRNTVVIGLILY
jgi:hypothetical protein